MRILLVGHGRMGQLVESLAPSYGSTIAGVIDEASGDRAIADGQFGSVDVAIDFTLAEAVVKNLPQLAERKINVVIGTTGWQAQEAAMGALNLPSAADIERVTRRLRSLSQRLEGIEDAMDRLEERAREGGGDTRLAAIEGRIDEIARDVASLRAALDTEQQPVPRAQERLTVTES